MELGYTRHMRYFVPVVRGERAVSSPTPPIDFDGAWKEALEALLPDFLALLFPRVHAAIDWAYAPEFLDKELDQLAARLGVAGMVVDKLVRVRMLGGGELRLLVHVEVQSQRDATFAERMFAYYAGLYLQHRLPTVSLAVLGDEQGGWRPERFDREQLGCDNHFRFPMVKLLDYRARRTELEASANPFALVVLAHLAAQDTRHDPEGRRGLKWALARRLYGRGYTREEMLRLYRFIDWLLELPGVLAAEFWRDLRAYEREQTVTFVTYAERVGREEELRLGVVQVLRQRFDAVPQEVVERIASVDDLDQLRALLTAAVAALDLPTFVASLG